jgi:hypothetical protein
VRTTEGEIVTGQSRPGSDLLDVLIDRYRALPRSGDAGNDLRYFTAALTRAVSSASLAPLLASAIVRLATVQPPQSSDPNGHPVG